MGRWPGAPLGSRTEEERRKRFAPQCRIPVVGGSDTLHRPKAGPPGLATGQAFHAIGLALLLVATWLVWSSLGRPSPAFFWMAVSLPVAHQLFVWFTWRVELGFAAVSRSVGFGPYLVLFYLLLVGRPVSLAILGWMDRGSLGLPDLPRAIVATLLLIPFVYTGYSVQRYFGTARAAGADHFDPRYRDKPLVKQGIFRYSRNAMYTYAFLGLWAIAVGFDSAAALVVAAFSHAYIWVHFHATEKPDMRYLYGQ